MVCACADGGIARLGELLRRRGPSPPLSSEFRPMGPPGRPGRGGSYALTSFSKRFLDTAVAAVDDSGGYEACVGCEDDAERYPVHAGSSSMSPAGSSSVSSAAGMGPGGLSPIWKLMVMPLASASAACLRSVMSGRSLLMTNSRRRLSWV